jgi:hypothetical protein
MGRYTGSRAGCGYRRNRRRRFFQWKLQRSESTDSIRPTQFDGTYDLERLPVGRNYNLYAGQLVAIALPSDFDVPADLCSQDGPPSCVAPVANTNFNVRTLPASPQLKLYGIVRTLEWRKAYDDIWLFTLALK